jgi:hypothetical protein
MKQKNKTNVRSIIGHHIVDPLRHRFDITRAVVLDSVTL